MRGRGRGRWVIPTEEDGFLLLVVIEYVFVTAWCNRRVGLQVLMFSDILVQEVMLA